ncbi:MAG: hypothetical protein V3U54_04640 [Thermodesulfobacteriota bacterium]|jgi:hypothetical protein
MKSFLYILVSCGGYLGLAFYMSHREIPEPCDCHIPLEYCEQKLKECNQYIAKYLTIGIE